MENNTENTVNTEVIAVAPTITPAFKMVTFRVLDQTGDSVFQKEMCEAVTEILNRQFKEGKWAYVGGHHMTLSAKNLKDTKGIADDTAMLTEKFKNDPAPTVVLTGQLVGGN